MKTYKELISEAKEVRLWLDDERDPRDKNTQLHFGSHGDEVWVKTYEEAITELTKGHVMWMSFDHDLGLGKTGYDVASWVERQAALNGIKSFKWVIHTMNPVGRNRIHQALANAEQFWRMQEQTTMHQSLSEGYSGVDYWYNPKKRKRIEVKRPFTFHISVPANKPKLFGVDEKFLLDAIETDLAAFDDDAHAEDILDELKTGDRDTHFQITFELLQKGWVRATVNKGTNSMIIEAGSLKEAHQTFLFETVKQGSIVLDLRLDINKGPNTSIFGERLLGAQVDFFKKHGKISKSKVLSFR